MEDKSKSNKKRCKEKLCMHCIYFKQHYVYYLGSMHSANCGHCMLKIGKTIRQSEKICENFKLLTKKQVSKSIKQSLECKIDNVLLILNNFKEYLDAIKKREY